MAKVELLKDFHPERMPLDAPVMIVLETAEELEWAYHAFSTANFGSDGCKGRQAVFNSNTAQHLNNFCAPFRSLKRHERS